MGSPAPIRTISSTRPHSATTALRGRGRACSVPGPGGHGRRAVQRVAGCPFLLTTGLTGVYYYRTPNSPLAERKHMSNIASRGSTMAVDWEQRIDFAKLRTDRLARARNALALSELGALLLFDPNNIRYVTSTHIGEWARDKNARFVLLPRTGDPVLWDFGSAARHHQLYAPWLPEDSFRAGVSPMRGAMPDETGVPDTLARTIVHELSEHGLAGEQVGIDMTDIVTL